MGNDIETASFLATEVHKNIQLKDVQTVQDIPNNFTLSIEDLGIWIDPIGKDIYIIVVTYGIDQKLLKLLQMQLVNMYILLQMIKVYIALQY